MSNCLFFALGRWLRRGGYVIIRRSHYGWWPHFIWSQNLAAFEEFHPVAGGRERTLPPLVFRGRVRHSSAAEQLLPIRK